MREWYALAAVERWRERLPDLTREEEDFIFKSHLEEPDIVLGMRNIAFGHCASSVMVNGALPISFGDLDDSSG